jgi:hypothetical protein
LLYAKKDPISDSYILMAGKLSFRIKVGELDTAKAMLRNGIPLQTVLLCTGLTEDQLAREVL